MRVKYRCCQNLQIQAQGNMVYLPADYTHTVFQCPARHQNSLSLLQGHCNPVISRRWRVITGKKKAWRIICILLETQPITSREYISLEKPVFSIGLMPLLLENAHATALLSRVMNLVKEAVEHLNPNQTPVLTMDQPLSAIAKEDAVAVA